MNSHRFDYSAKFVPSRRQFLKVSAGAGLALGLNLGVAGSSAQQGNSDSLLEYNAFVSISPDNIVRVMIRNTEMGQGPYTGLATCIAEELDADWNQIVCEHAPANTEKYGNAALGSQGTGGSSSVPGGYIEMREAGAAAKAMLVAAAAEQWNVPETEIEVNNGVLAHGNRTSSFGELAVAAARQSVPSRDSLQLKSAGEFKFIGNEELSRKDIGKNDGTAIFTQDIKLPGMLTAVVVHPPRFGGKVQSFDASDALAIDGVQHVFDIEDGIAVVANDYWTALKAKGTLHVEWDDSEAEHRSTENILQQYHEIVQTPGAVAESVGDADSLLAASDDVHELEFEFPFLSHAQMEPLNCVAMVDGDRAELTYGCQTQTRDQEVVAELLGTDVSKVSIKTVFAGGGFGRRANPFSDYVLETVRIAQRLQGTPIKLVWSREDDMEAGYWRPAYVHKLAATLNSDNNPEALQVRVAGQSIMEGTALAERAIVNGIDHSSMEGLVGMTYAIPNRQVELHTTKVGIPVQWFRSVGNTRTAFSKEVFIDHLAESAGEDPLNYRLKLFAGNAKETEVLNFIAEKSDWRNFTASAGKGRGLAIHSSFGSTVAQVVDVTVDGDNFTVDRVIAAVHVGTAVNPDIVKAQAEGSIVLGLSSALSDQVTLTDGLVDQNNFHTYQVLRMNRMPEIEVHIVPSEAMPTGIGEPATPVIAPAVANVIAAATGKRLTSLPLRLA